jgi:hypothetical protein
MGKQDHFNDKQLTNKKEEGWVRQFTVEKKRVNEYVELYESFGYEVRVEPATPNEMEECQVCFKFEFDNLQTIYTRQREKENKSTDLE